MVKDPSLAWAHAPARTGCLCFQLERSQEAVALNGMFDFTVLGFMCKMQRLKKKKKAYFPSSQVVIVKLETPTQAVREENPCPKQARPHSALPPDPQTDRAGGTCALRVASWQCGGPRGIRVFSVSPAITLPSGSSACLCHGVFAGPSSAHLSVPRTSCPEVALPADTVRFRCHCC